MPSVAAILRPRPHTTASGTRDGEPHEDARCTSWRLAVEPALRTKRTIVPAERAPKVVVDDLTVIYSRGGLEVTAIERLSINVADGEFLAIVGQSGCGKSTLLKAIDGLVPAASGSIEIDGTRVTRPSPRKAMVFQDGRLLPWRTVMGNVSLPLEGRRLPRGEARERAMREIERVGLTRFARAWPNQLSGGMQQRVNLARALVMNPQVLLLDEPFAALDAHTREYMQQELLNIWERERTTAIFVTHQIDEAIFLADRVIVLSTSPGRLKREFVIDIPRPRHLEIKRTAAFHAYEDAIWAEIGAFQGDEAAQAAVGSTAAGGAPA
jgi:NitT/TauT family transport system ATP-binding protein